MLDLFYNDERINSYTTMVPGSDMVEMLGLFHDLGEAIHVVNIKKIQELENYKTAYNNNTQLEKRFAEWEDKIVAWDMFGGEPMVVPMFFKVLICVEFSLEITLATGIRSM